VGLTCPTRNTSGVASAGSAPTAPPSRQAGCWHGRWAAQLTDEPVTVNALNPGYVQTALTRNVGGPLKVLVALTAFAAQTPLDGADTAIWLAASPEVEGVTGKFFDKRREVRCPFRDSRAICELCDLVDRQLAPTSPRQTTVSHSFKAEAARGAATD
jgi:hypothetical protein